MALKDFSGSAVQTTLAAAIGPSDNSMTVASGSTYPPGGALPFVITLERGTVNEEKVLVALRTGNVLSGCTRSYDGSSPSAHAVAAKVEHTIDAGTVKEANAHANDDGTHDYHGLYLTVARHDITARHLVGTSIPAGAPVTTGPDNSAGTSTSASRADHVHRGLYLVCTSGARPVSPADGQRIYETDTGNSLIYVASLTAWMQEGGTGAWLPYTSAFYVGGVLSTLNVSSLTARYQRAGSAARFRAEVVFGGAPALGAMSIKLPFVGASEMQQMVSARAVCAGVATHGYGLVPVGSQTAAIVLPSRAADGVDAAADQTGPFPAAWAATDSIHIWGTFEID